MDPFLGEIRLFPWGWAPAGWLPCEGQILPFNSNIALASLLGNRYGGNGSTTFGLPDLRGRVALGQNYVASTSPAIGMSILIKPAISSRDKTANRSRSKTATISHLKSAMQSHGQTAIMLMQ